MNATEPETGADVVRRALPAGLQPPAAAVDHYLRNVEEAVGEAKAGNHQEVGS